MNLKELGKEMPYRWRVQSFSKNKPQASCVAYIDARDAMKLLDEVCGPENWQDDYREIGGMLFGGLAIRVNKEWIWKWDTGSESNIEKEKGHVSDSFKRAAVKWGIGRFLYDLEIQYVNASEKKTQNNYPYVVDDNGKRVWDLTKHINSRNGKSRPAPKTPVEQPETGHTSTQAENKGNGKEHAFVPPAENLRNEVIREKLARDDHNEPLVLRELIIDMLTVLSGEQREKFKDLLEGYTEFQGKDGSKVAGTRNFKELHSFSDKRIAVIYGKIKPEWEEAIAVKEELDNMFPETPKKPD